MSFTVLTSAGGAALRKAAPVHLAGIRRQFTDHLTAADRTRLVTPLGKVIAAHRPPIGDQPPPSLYTDAHQSSAAP